MWLVHREGENTVRLDSLEADRHSSPSNTVELPLYSQDILYVINAIETFDRLREGIIVRLYT